MRDDEDRPRPPATHAIGQALDALSVGELDHRVALLRAETDRLETARRTKQAALDAADAVFRRQAPGAGARSDEADIGSS